jgi:C4-dicarboxylate-specific signal transduction histidine kinase
VAAQLTERRAAIAAAQAAAATRRTQAEQDRALQAQLLTRLRLVQTRHREQESELRVVFERYYQVRVRHAVIRARVPNTYVVVFRG